MEPKTDDEVIKALYHENKKIRKNLRDLSEHLSAQLEKQKLNILKAHKQVANDNGPQLIPGLQKLNPRDIEQALFINEQQFEKLSNNTNKQLRNLESEYFSLIKLQRKVFDSQQTDVYLGELQVQQKLQSIEEDLQAALNYKNDSEKRIKQNDKELTRLANCQDAAHIQA